jgi:phosphatidate phosphatase APP1
MRANATWPAANIVILVSAIIVAANSHELDGNTIVRCFDTYAFPSSFSSQDWMARIRCAAVYDEGGPDILSKVARKLRSMLHKNKANAAADARWDTTTTLFRYDPVRGKDIYIQFTYGSTDRQLIGCTNKYGVTEADIQVPISAIKDHESGKFVAEFRVVYPEGVVQQASGLIMIPSGSPPFGVFSDIDDTIKITRVLSIKQMLYNAFEEQYRPVPTMRYLYQHINNLFRDQRQAPLFYYVSGTPWQLIDVLSQFIDQYYPMGELMLQKFRLSIGSLIRLSNIRKYKTGRFDLIHKRFPELRWYLIGDSGQLDPEIYAEIYKRYPDRIICIWIVKTQGTDVEKERKQNADSRFQKAFKEVPLEKWNAFDEPATIMQLPEGKCR